MFDGKVFISTGYEMGCALIDISGPEAKLVWKNKNMRNHASTSILLDGYVYGIDGNQGPKNELRCLELASGKVMWAKPLVWGGFMAADGKLIVINDCGDIFVVKANPKAYEEIASAKGLLQKECWTAPVLCRGVIYFRNNIGDLIAVDVSEAKGLDTTKATHAKAPQVPGKHAKGAGINLLPMIDAKKDAAHGTWDLKDGGLLSDGKGHAHLQIP